MKYTLNVQGVCNSMGRFIDLDINWPGGTHEAMREGKIPKMSRVLLSGRDVATNSNCTYFLDLE